MPRCLSCTRTVSDDARYCAACGAALEALESPTGTAPRPVAGSTPPRTPASSSSSRMSATASSHGRFVPGEVVGGRFRILGLLGRGGMGEVYRADDLKLDQAVALKFLPEALKTDAERRERFMLEVSVARQVSHPAVCRVYDVAELDGHLFLAMEYVDGEDLSALLRRIGRLPSDKAVQIARQLCAGVAAAHDRGVLHRDLKPQNVMLDGRGKARLTDFGLAGLAEAIQTGDVRSGTPAYMSPEQFDGREVSTRSDIYSLGLVLYEIFTGRRPFEGKSYSELARQHRDEAPPPPSELVQPLDPAIERVILRCLEKDPHARPSSALAVAAELPGGDPLAAALAAGETPSPALVAAAGQGEGLRPALAATLLIVALAGLALIPRLTRPMLVNRLAPMEKTPAALEDRARELIRELGWGESVVDSARGFSIDHDYLNKVAKESRARDRWDALAIGQPPAVRFWYRQGPRPLVSNSMTGRVSSQNPPLMISGMTGANFDMRGRLVSFYAVPPQLEEPAGSDARARAEVDWNPLFAAARLDPGRFNAVEPRWTPPFYADQRAAWEGVYPDRPDLAFRLEAGAYRGRPVYFMTVDAWTRPSRQQPYPFTTSQRLAFALVALMVLSLIAVGAALARRHLAHGKGDRVGAFRLAAFVFVVGMAAWAISADHVSDLPDEIVLAIRGTGMMLLMSGIVWVFYLALEPYVRKRWPHVLISWTRLLSGRWRDPLVGRDVLLGVAGGIVTVVVASLVQALFLARSGLPPRHVGIDLLANPARYVTAQLLFGQLNAVSAGMGILLLVLLMRLLLRSSWLATLIALAITCLPESLAVELPLWMALPIDMLLVSLPFLILVRFGLVASVACMFVMSQVMAFPITDDFADWTAGPTKVLLLLLAGLALYGFRVALAGRPLFKGLLAHE